MFMGGTHDEFTLNDLRPMYEHLPGDRIKVELEGAGHLAFTDVCRMGLPVPELIELCDPATHLDTDTAFAIIHHFAAAFLRYWLEDETGLAGELRPEAADRFEQAVLEVGAAS